MLKSLWGRITGADKKKQYPVQQAVFLSRAGDYVILHPYGSFCDLPNDVLLSQIGDKSAIAATVKRPSDTARGEPVLFHPKTNTRIIFRNNGDLDIITTQGGGDINVQTVDVNIEASGDVQAQVSGDMTAEVAGTTTFDTPEAVITGNLTVQGDTTLGANVTSNGKDISDTHTHGGSPTAPTGAVSPTGVPV